MEEPSAENRIDGDEVEALDVEALKAELDEMTKVGPSEVDEEAKAKEEEDAKVREEEEAMSELTVRVKGIPFEGITKEDITALFEHCGIEDDGIFIAPLTCVAYVQFKDAAGVRRALENKNYSFLGRPLAVSRAKPFHRTKDIGVAAAAEDFKEAPCSVESSVVQIRFLPYWTTENRVIEFYKDFALLGVHMVWDHVGRTGAQCFVEFSSEEDQKNALGMKGGLGKRVRSFPLEHAKLDEMFAHLHVKGVDKDALVIKMSQLPYSITEDDIYTFFKGVDVTGAYLAKNWTGQGTGVGFITVANHEQAFKAWAKTGHRISIVGGETAKYNDRKNILLAASTPTELTSTLISMYVRERNAFAFQYNRVGYGGGRGRGGYGGRGRGGYGGRGRGRF